MGEIIDNFSWIYDGEPEDKEELTYRALMDEAYALDNVEPHDLEKIEAVFEKVKPIWENNLSKYNSGDIHLSVKKVILLCQAIASIRILLTQLLKQAKPEAKSKILSLKQRVTASNDLAQGSKFSTDMVAAFVAKSRPNPYRA